MSRSTNEGMRDARGDNDLRHAPWLTAGPATLALAALSGICFGFLLQKGGVARFDILIGALLLEDFVVAKIILSAITVGMLVFHFLERSGLVEAKIQATSLASNVLGGLLFGVGFALLAYCPGTDAAAIGQGNYDAIVGVGGMMLGSYAFAVLSRRIHESVGSHGNLGKLTLPSWLGVRRGTFIAVAAPVLVLVLLGLEQLD